MSVPTSLIPEAKRRLQELAAEHIVADYQDYRSAVLTDGTPVDLRQLIDIQMRLTGAEMEKKSGLYDGLAVFNFHISTGSAPMELEMVQEAAELQKTLGPYKEIEAVEAPWPFKDVIEAPVAPSAPQDAPVTAETLLESLDEMLAGAVPLDD